jgi:hypothetical protein
MLRTYFNAETDLQNLEELASSMLIDSFEGNFDLPAKELGSRTS